jgi:3',5'-cyclic AMP phosphodiesterase CpdA
MNMLLSLLVLAVACICLTASSSLPQENGAETTAGAAGSVRGLQGPPPKPPSIEAVDFFFFGDWGSNVPANESESLIPYEEAKVAAQVNKFAARVKPNFIVPLGDNFYNNGVVSTTDPLWENVYRRLFTAPATFVPWYPVMGNHDYYLTHTPQAEINYYFEHKDSRWTFPDYQYTRKWTIPGSKQTMEIVFINTVTLCPESHASDIGWPTNANDDYPVKNKASYDLDRLIWQPTLQWISNTLAASTADLLMVAGHYHIYTNTIDDVSGTTEGYCLQDKLVPLLKKYGVTAYIHGHEHNFEHFVLDGISYYTVGHGSDKDDPISPGTHPAGLLYNKTVGGFGWANVKPSKLTVKFIDYKGVALYAYENKFKSAKRRLRDIDRLN